MGLPEKRAIFKFINPEKTVYQTELRQVKLLMPYIEKLPGEAYYCYRERTRSGMHWHECVRMDNGEVVYGWVRRYMVVARWHPMTVADYLKPIPREGKNIVTVSVGEFENMHYEIAGRIANAMPNPEELLLVTSHEGFELLLYRPYDFKYLVKKVANQANLIIYEIVTDGVNVKPLEKIDYAVGRTLDVSQHTAVFTARVMFSCADGWHMYNVEACVVRLRSEQNVTLLHPEHEEVTVRLRPGYYLFWHYRPRDTPAE